MIKVIRANRVAQNKHFSLDKKDYEHLTIRPLKNLIELIKHYTDNGDDAKREEVCERLREHDYITFTLHDEEETLDCINFLLTEVKWEGLIYYNAAAEQKRPTFISSSLVISELQHFLATGELARVVECEKLGIYAYTNVHTNHRFNEMKFNNFTNMEFFTPAKTTLESWPWSTSAISCSSDAAGSVLEAAAAAKLPTCLTITGDVIVAKTTGALASATAEFNAAVRDKNSELRAALEGDAPEVESFILNTRNVSFYNATKTDIKLAGISVKDISELDVRDIELSRRTFNFIVDEDLSALTLRKIAKIFKRGDNINLMTVSEANPKIIIDLDQKHEIYELLDDLIVALSEGGRRGRR